MKIRRCLKCMTALRDGVEACPVCGRVYGASVSESFALRPGTILDGKYLVGEMLGQGGFGITYLGFDLLLEQKVAIKEYFPMSTGMVSREGQSTVVWSTAMMGKTGAERGFDSFLKEARKMAKLGGIPGVVGVKSVFIENETAYIVMDYIEGETLQKKLEREGPMDFGTCVTLLTPMIHSLGQVHSHGIIHRDISPDNIMVQKDGSLVLLDLGAAKDLDIQKPDGTIQSSQLVAKHGFSPFEQYSRTGNLGPWTDVYAMAATIYYCCTGRVPTPAVERMEEDTLTCQPKLTPAQFQRLLPAMAISIKNRTQTMEDLARTLTSQKPPRPTPDPPKPPQKLPKWAVAVMAALVVLLLLSTGKNRGDPSPTLRDTSPGSAPRITGSLPTETEPVKTAPAETTFPTTIPVETTPATVTVSLLGGEYTGPVNDRNLPQGEGSLVWEEGSYQGSFVNGYPEGEGVFFYFGTEELEPVDGIWSYGEGSVPFGIGYRSKYTWADYTGMLLDGKPWGYGRADYGNGSVFTGCFRDSHPEGKGTCQFYNGDKESGLFLWKEGMKETLHDERQGGNLTYTGMTRDGQAWGWGYLECEKSGGFYGEFRYGVPNGAGIYQYRPRHSGEDGEAIYGRYWSMTYNNGSLDGLSSYSGLLESGAAQGYGLGITNTRFRYHYVGEIKQVKKNGKMVGMRWGYGRLYTPQNDLDKEGLFVDGEYKEKW